jgi:hypothetical protein
LTQVNSHLNRDVADMLVDDRLREAERFRRTRVESRETPDAYDSITVRLARPADADALQRLSQLEGRSALTGATIVAEVGGTVVAARSLETGDSVADPFEPSAALSELLALRATHIRDASEDGVPRRRVRMRLRALRRTHKLQS